MSSWGIIPTVFLANPTSHTACCQDLPLRPPCGTRDHAQSSAAGEPTVPPPPPPSPPAPPAAASARHQAEADTALHSSSFPGKNLTLEEVRENHAMANKRTLSPGPASLETAGRKQEDKEEFHPRCLSVRGGSWHSPFLAPAQSASAE